MRNKSKRSRFAKDLLIICFAFRLKLLKSMSFIKDRERPKVEEPLCGFLTKKEGI